MINNLINKNKESIRVAVAMSGGVDSSIAAVILTEKYGKENVFGVTMRLFCYGEKEVGLKNCCSLDAINDAKAVCKKLGIKHYVLDFEKEFKREVIDNFVSQYLAGKTPNPCIRCNTIIKFGNLLAKVLSLGADCLATGHYARIKQLAINNKQLTEYKLLKGLDEKKDQSYFLYGMTQEQLAHILFPLGDYRKDKVRNLAKRYCLKTAEKAESQEICFIASDNNYHGFLRTRIGAEKFKEGDIIDKEGNILGRHKGLSFYTIGQRRGIGIARNNPLYVTNIDKKNNKLIVGEEEELYGKEFTVSDLSWISGNTPIKEFSAEVSIRYNMIPVEAKIIPKGKKAKVIFYEPQKAITPGQSAVFYAGDEILGGGVIIEANN